MNVVAEVREAEARIRPYIRETPLEPSPALGDRSGLDVHLKLENVQRTGSFKLRGVMNRLLTLTEEERGHGVITASVATSGPGAVGSQTWSRKWRRYQRTTGPTD